MKNYKFSNPNAKLFSENKDEFKRIFGINLLDYFCPITGFDIVRFDDNFIKSPDGKSMRQVIQEKYGNEGVELIERLIKFPKD